jgi:hypothetical protein
MMMDKKSTEDKKQADSNVEKIENVAGIFRLSFQRRRIKMVQKYQIGGHCPDSGKSGNLLIFSGLHKNKGRDWRVLSFRNQTIIQNNLSPISA